MKFRFALVAAVAGGMAFGSTASADVIITGIMDGDLSGGTPKAIELYICGTEDLSLYSLERASNGSGTFGSTTALSGVYTDQFVYLVGTGFDGVNQFISVFGSSGDFANVFASGTVSGNGNDAFRIIDSLANVVDQVNDELDGTNVYQDSYMYRNDNTGPDGGWVAGNWQIPGNGVLDTLDAAGHESTVPFGTYSKVVIPAPAAIAMFGIAGLAARRRRRA